MPPPTPALTPGLNHCIQHAFNLAREARHEYLTLEHLLLALQDDPQVLNAVAACGGDATRLHIVRGLLPPSDWNRMQLAELDSLRDLIEKTGAALVIVDPMHSYLGAAYARVAKIRATLDGVARLAEDLESKNAPKEE